MAYSPSLIARYDTRCFLYIVTVNGLNAFNAYPTANRFHPRIISTSPRIKEITLVRVARLTNVVRAMNIAFSSVVRLIQRGETKGKKERSIAFNGHTENFRDKRVICYSRFCCRLHG